MSNIFEENEGRYETWLKEISGLDWQDTTVPSEKNMIEILSNAIRENNPEWKAKQYIDLANMALAMADETLGCHSLVVTSLTLIQH